MWRSLCQSLIFFHFQLQLLSKIQCNRSEIFTASPVKLILHAKALKIEGMDSVNKTKRSIRKERHQERNNYNRKEKETKRQVGISFVLNFCVAVSQARLTMVLIKSNFCLRVLFLIYFVICNCYCRWRCLYCSELWSMSSGNEVWIQCQTCGRWAHIDILSVNCGPETNRPTPETMCYAQLTLTKS